MPNSANILIDARPLVDQTAGGVRRVAINILRALLEHLPYTHFTLATTGLRQPTLPKPFREAPNASHVHIKLPNKLWSSLSMLGTTSLDRRVSQETRANFDAALLLNLGFTGRLNLPYALILHDLSFLIEPGWFPWKERLWHSAVRSTDLIRAASRLFCVSETTAQDASRLLGASRDRIEVFQPGIPDLPTAEPNSSPQSTVYGLLRPRLSREAGRAVSPFVLTFGASNPRKNVATAICAVRELRREAAFKNLHLVIVGVGKAEGERRTPDWIVRKNNLTDEELALLYQHASALLYPSWYEGYGLPLHEAARFGLPCLAGAHGALPLTAPRGTILIPPMKPQLWVGTLRQVLRWPESYRTLTEPNQAKPSLDGLINWIKNKSLDR